MTDDLQTIYMISDGTCRTCEQVLKAVLLQFDAPKVHLVRKANVRRAKTVTKVIREAREKRAVVFYTLVLEEARRAVKAASLEYMVPVVDLLGPVLGSLYDLFSNVPRSAPGLLYDSNKAYFNRIDAVEYTLGHDDGRGMHELRMADVVLVGVSRACKSTTCFYLAYRGVRAANVPLFPNEKLPKELLEVDPRRVIGLMVNPHRLQSVREARLHGWGMNDDLVDYADRIQIAREIRAANQYMEQLGWRRVDVSYKAIEEISREILAVLEESGIEIGKRDTDNSDS